MHPAILQLTELVEEVGIVEQYKKTIVYAVNVQVLRRLLLVFCVVVEEWWRKAAAQPSILLVRVGGL